MWSAHGHSSDWTVVRLSGVSIVNLLVPTSLESTCLWVAYQQLLPPGGNLSSYKTAQRMWPRILSMALEEGLKVLEFV